VKNRFSKFAFKCNVCAATARLRRGGAGDDGEHYGWTPFKEHVEMKGHDSDLTGRGLCKLEFSWPHTDCLAIVYPVRTNTR
jgi:hypothetical protein